jgi:hypothetical protein
VNRGGSLIHRLASVALRDAARRKRKLIDGDVVMQRPVRALTLVNCGSEAQQCLRGPSWRRQRDTS